MSGGLDGDRGKCMWRWSGTGDRGFSEGVVYPDCDAFGLSGKIGVGKMDMEMWLLVGGDIAPCGWNIASWDTGI